MPRCLLRYERLLLGRVAPSSQTRADEAEAWADCDYLGAIIRRRLRLAPPGTDFPPPAHSKARPD